MDIEKLRAVLADLGIEEEKIEAAIEALSEEEPVEEKSEGEGEEPSTSDVEPKEEDAKPEDVPVEGEGDVDPSQDEVPAEPVSVPEEVVPEEVVPEVEEPEVPVEDGAELPVEVAPEQPPVVSLEDFEQVKSDLEETKKALDGLKATNESLLEALRSAGVISGGQLPELGHDDPSAPVTRVDDTMDSVLREINRKGY